VGIRRAVLSVTTHRVDESGEFYTALLVFQGAIDMGWIVTLASPHNPTARTIIVRGERAVSANANVTLTVEVGDVDAVHVKAVSRAHDIVYPLTTEPRGTPGRVREP